MVATRFCGTETGLSIAQVCWPEPDPEILRSTTECCLPGLLGAPLLAAEVRHDF